MKKLTLYLLATSAAFVIVATAAQAQSTRTRTDPNSVVVRDLTRELSNKMTGNYTLALAGDVLMQEPMGKRISPELKSVLRNADTTIGNAEVFIVDRRFWAGPNGYGNNWAPKEVAQDWADLGFDLMGAGEAAGGEAGMISTLKIMDEAGIKVGGYGPNLTVARQPVFQELEQGRVAMVYALPVGPVASPSETARDKTGNEGGEQWGLNTLKLTQSMTVTAEQLAQLKAIRDSVVARRSESDVTRPIDIPKDKPDSVELQGKTYVLGDKPGNYLYAMDPKDKQAQVLAVRGAKEYADFAIFSMHMHENRYAFQAYSQDHYPTDYAVRLAHELIDNGLDVFHGQGNHTMQGIEIYKGRPIFYNLGNLSVHRFGADGTPDGGDGKTYIEDGEVGEQWLQQDINLMAFLAEVDYKDGRLTQVRIHPADLGLGKERPWSRMNIPMKPSPENAERILRLIQEYSKPFGTVITIKDGVGYIDVPDAATVSVGGDIRAGFAK